MKLVQYNECLVSIVDSADYAPMRFPVFKGKTSGLFFFHI